MSERFTPRIERTIDVAASIDAVWALVSDPTAPARWSPQVAEIVITTDGPVGVGTRTTNRNRVGELEWETQSEVVAFDPPVRFAMRTRGGRAVFTFELEALPDDRCRVLHHRSTPDGVSDIALELEAAAFGSVSAFEEQLADGMAATLERLRAEAERDSVDDAPPPHAPGPHS